MWNHGEFASTGKRSQRRVVWGPIAIERGTQKSGWREERARNYGAKVRVKPIKGFKYVSTWRGIGIGTIKWTRRTILWHFKWD